MDALISGKDPQNLTKNKSGGGEIEEEGAVLLQQHTPSLLSARITPLQLLTANCTFCQHEAVSNI